MCAKADIAKRKYRDRPWKASWRLGVLLMVLGIADPCGSQGPWISARRDTSRSGETAIMRPVTLEDVIAMNRLAEPAYLGGGSSAGHVAHFSPDGTKFVVLLRKGNLKDNSNDYSLLLWQTDSVLRSPRPDVLLTLSSTSNRPAIQSVSWREDNETLLFLGESPGERQQLYSFQCRTRRLKQVTHSRTNVLAYGIGGANTIAYTAETPRPREDASADRQGRVITTQLITEVLTGRPEEHWSDHARLILRSGKSQNGTVTLDNRLLMPFPFPEDHPVVSPNGKYVLVLENVERIPASWRDYRDSRMQKWTHWETDSGQYSMLRRYVLFEAETRQKSVLLDAPISLGGGADSEAAWSPDSKSVVITNTYLPLQNTSDEERGPRLAGPFVVEVHVRTGEITKISSRELKLVRWERRTNEVTFEDGRGRNATSLARLYFRKRGTVWESVSRPDTVRHTPEIVLEEGMNRPPQIVAAQADEKRAVLLDLNPQFKTLQFGREELIRWKARDGHEVEGGLYFPVGYVPGRRYPLVIQTHGFRPDRFDIDGPYTSAFAAQPLAGRGIMVLQAEKPDQSELMQHLATEQEAAWRVSAYEGAIDYLDARGLIDRERVGIIGFSRTCWYVKYALTHSQFHYAAASVMDGFDMGYFSYVAMANRSYPDNEMDQIMGSTPVGDGLRNWLKQSPGFNVERVPRSVPVRIVASYPLDVLVEWEWFSMMKRLRRPVDMIVFLDGVHLLEKPWDRIISQGGNADWFDFWLNGHEDPDPAKADQYKRWKQLREVVNEASRAENRRERAPDASPQ